MTTIKLLKFTSSCFTRTYLGETSKTISNFSPAGVANFKRNFASTKTQPVLTYPTSFKLGLLDVKPFTAYFKLTDYPRVYFSSKTPSQNENKPKSDNKDGTTAAKSFDETNIDDLIFGEASQLTQFQKFKLMYRKYWYVLVPVHITTSISWIVGFYYLSKSGFDIPSMLQTIHISETIIDKVKNSNMGHYAIAYLCYKIITPLRYAVSLGLTTISIKRLVLAGYIKPMPTRKELVQMYEKNKVDRAKRREDAKNS